MGNMLRLLACAATIGIFATSAACGRSSEESAAGEPAGGRASAAQRDVVPTSGVFGAPAPTWRPGSAAPLDDPLPMTNPYAGDEQAIEEGERFWNWYNCSGCHSAGAGGGMGPSLIDDIWIYGSDDARAFESIWNGRQAGMPAWADFLPEDAAWKIIAFIRAAPRRSAWPWNDAAPE